MRNFHRLPVFSTNLVSFVTVFVIVIMIALSANASQSKWNTVSETIGCYECKSNSHKNCNDPFNGTAGLFPVEPCKGCCVKIVRHYNTNREVIWRTCTEKLEISHSLVHSDVCMGESNGHGHLCICGESRCNSSQSLNANCSAFLLFLASLLLLVM